MDQGLSIETLLHLAREQSGTALPTADFNTWMKRNGLSRTTAAQALGLSRRTIIDYNTAQQPTPLHIGLTCEGWEVRHRCQAAECTHSQGPIGNTVGEAPSRDRVLGIILGIAVMGVLDQLLWSVSSIQILRGRLVTGLANIADWLQPADGSPPGP